MRILGIESSADETAAAVIESTPDGQIKLLSSEIASSIDLHTVYGGIVPEIAARSHLESIIPLIDKALKNAFKIKDKRLRIKEGYPQSQISNLKSDDLWSSIDAIAVTKGPGLLGGLLIGVLTAKTLAIAKNKPLYGINHVQAHIYSSFITTTSPSLSKFFTLPSSPPTFPILALIVSGGHTQLVFMKSHTDYRVLGQTKDDAVGEAFDKVAKMLGLPYPGGPSIEAVAKNGNPKAYKFPKARLENSYDFSFSGPKTAVLRAAQNVSGNDFTFPSNQLPRVLSDAQKADIAGSFQHSAITTLVDSLLTAEKQFNPKTIVVAGGVAANQLLRDEVEKRLSTPVIYPDIKLCTDNAAMIAAAAYYQVKNHQQAANPFLFDVMPNLAM